MGENCKASVQALEERAGVITFPNIHAFVAARANRHRVAPMTVGIAAQNFTGKPIGLSSPAMDPEILQSLADGIDPILCTRSIL